MMIVKTTSVEGLPMRYAQGGSGKQAVVLLHGWGCDYSIFADLCRQLEGRWRVYALDLPGFGGSAEPPVVWSTDLYKRWLRLWLEQQGIEQPVLVGHSFGGRVAIRLAAEWQGVRKVVLMGAAGVPPHRPLWSRLLGFNKRGLLRRLERVGLLAGVLERLRRALGSVDYVQASALMRQVLVLAVREDLRPLLPNISAPTLLIWGDRDTATPLWHGQVMERTIPDAGLVVLPGTHYVFLERSSQVAAIIMEFLKNDV